MTSASASNGAAMKTTRKPSAYACFKVAELASIVDAVSPGMLSRTVLLVSFKKASMNGPTDVLSNSVSIAAFAR